MKNIFKKAFRPIKVYRMDIEDSLKGLPNEDISFPYRFRWNAIGKEVKRIDVVCSKDKAIWLDIQYYDKV